MHANPFAALSDEDLIAAAGAVPDPVYLAEQRGLFVDLCTIYGAANVHLAVDEDGDVLMLRPSPWRVDGCKDLSGLADDLYADGAR